MFHSAQEMTGLCPFEARVCGIECFVEVKINFQKRGSAEKT